MKKVKIVKMSSLTADPTHSLDPMDVSRFYGYASVDGKRIGSIDHLYRRKEYRFMPDFNRRDHEQGIKRRTLKARTLCELKVKIGQEF